jgi:predicted cupin superfamily sugar epimerase
VSNLNDEARRLIEILGLVLHPEGGLYCETYRAPLNVAAPQGERSACTAIYFLLPAGSFSALHRVRSDEVWHHYAGDPVELHVIDERGRYRVAQLGADFALGHRPQQVVPAGAWQAAVPLGGRFALCGCTVAPGFDFADFELAARADLVAKLPALRPTIERFTRT